MKKLVRLFFILIVMSAISNAQGLSKNLIPIDGTTKDSLLIGRYFKHVMAMDRAKRLDLRQGSVAMWDTARKAFVPLKAFRIDNAGMFITFDSLATYKYYDIDRHQWMTWRVDSVYTTTKQNTDEISFQADRVTTLFFGLDTLYTSMQSSFKIQAGEIEAKVSETDYNGKTIASLINLQPDSIKIQSKNIELDGKAIFRSISGGTDSTVIDGSYLKTGTVSADFIRADTIQNKLFLGSSVCTSSSLDSWTDNAVMSGGSFTAKTTGISDDYLLGVLNSGSVSITNLRQSDNVILSEGTLSSGGLQINDYTGIAKYSSLSATGLTVNNRDILTELDSMVQKSTGWNGTFTAKNQAGIESTYTVVNGQIVNEE